MTRASELPAEREREREKIDAARLSLDEHRLTPGYRCTLPFSRAGWSYCLRRCRMWSNGLY